MGKGEDGKGEEGERQRERERERERGRVCPTLGGSHCMTRSTSGMSRPRAATSVAISNGNFPSLKP